MDYKKNSESLKDDIKHVGEFVALIITASFNTRSEGELVKVFSKMKNGRLF